MQNNTFQLPVENNELPVTNTGGELVNSDMTGIQTEHDPRLNLGRAITELDANVESEEWPEHANIGRKQALLTAKYVIGLRQQTSTDPTKAPWS